MSLYIRKQFCDRLAQGLRCGVASPGDRAVASPAARVLLDALAARGDGGPAALAGAWAELSDGYRAGRPTPGDHRFGADDARAYAVGRAPATVAAVGAVLDEVAVRLPGWAPTSVLDVGAGLGTASWTAMAALPSLVRGALVERASAMVDLGRALGELAPLASIRGRSWRRGDATDVGAGTSDLVLASYVLSELTDAEVARAVDSWWAATSGQLMIIDAGTPAGFARLRRARSQLVTAGARVVAPCPGDGTCPMSGQDWCHFAVRLDRSAAHRGLKGASLGFEDEKFSYVVVSRARGAVPAARVLRHPQVRSGHVRLQICRDDGATGLEATELVVAKRHGDRYRWARKAVWGDPVPAAVLARGEDRPPAEPEWRR